MPNHLNFSRRLTAQFSLTNTRRKRASTAATTAEAGTFLPGGNEPNYGYTDLNLEFTSLPLFNGVPQSAGSSQQIQVDTQAKTFVAMIAWYTDLNGNDQPLDDPVYSMQSDGKYLWNVQVQMPNTAGEYELSVQAFWADPASALIVQTISAWFAVGP